MRTIKELLIFLILFPNIPLDGLASARVRHNQIIQALPQSYLAPRWGRPSKQCMPHERALQLMKKHNEEILWILSDSAKKSYRDWENVKFDWLPGYIMKLHARERIAGEKIFRDCIEQYELYLLIVPHHWAYPVPPQSNPFFNDPCLCEYIDGTTFGKPINLAQAQQLITLITRAEKPNWDLHPGNLVITPSGQIALIDTEINCFGGTTSDALRKLLARNEFEPDAGTFLHETIKNFKMQ